MYRWLAKRPRKASGAVALAFLAVGVEAETVRRVKDINTTAPAGIFSPRLAIGSTLYFRSCTNPPETGCALWKLGPSGAPEKIVDTQVNSWESTTAEPPVFLNASGSLLFFAGNERDTALWKSDGTAAGTVLVRAFPYALSPVGKLSMDGSGLFSVRFMGGSGTTTDELWRSDGTPEGTVRLDSGPSVRSVTNANGTLFLTTSSSTPGFYATALLKRDGVSGVQQELARLGGGSSDKVKFGFFRPLTAVGTSVFFSGVDAQGDELWRSDGTVAGTGRVKDIAPGSLGSRPLELANVNGVLFFSADDGVHGRELWKSDGTAAGTLLVKDVVQGGSSSTPSLLTAMNGALYFRACDSSECVLWKSDGTDAGTVKLGAAAPLASGALPSEIVAANGVLYVSATDGAHGRELWKSGGTVSGTVLVKDIQPGPAGSTPSLLTAASGYLAFSACDGALCRLWRSDGTDAGTASVGGATFETSKSSPTNLTDVNGTLFFGAADGVGFSGRDLWRSDGTDQGTIQVQDFSLLSGTPSLQNLTRANGNLYFTTYDSSGLPGGSLWRTDGTASGTTLIRSFTSASGRQAPSDLLDVDGTLFFGADDGTNGLWKTDGTASGTTQLGAFQLYAPSALASLSGKVYFNASSTLWRSDGTAAGTVQVSSLPLARFVRAGNVLFLSSGTSLYKSDGTAPNTTKVADLANNGVRSLTDVGGRLFFSGYSDVELWTSDGTTLGTTKLHLRADASGSQPTGLFEMNGVLYFTADDGVHGREMWRSDGTLAGTTLVKDINPGSGSGIDANLFSGESEAVVFAKLGNKLYFSADDGVHGKQLWRSDGTGAGTVMVADVVATNLTASGDRLFFVAKDGELWVLERSTTQTVLSSTANPARLGDPVTFTATVSVTPDACAVPSGTLVFSDGARMLGTATLSGGLASLSTSTLNVGSHTITATYAGDRDCAGSVSSPLSQTITAFPALSINDVSQAEGNTGTSAMTFDVTLSPASLQTVNVALATRDVTATSASDYSASSGTLTFLAGETRKTVAVSILGDTKAESNESFNVDLSGAQNAVIVRGRGTGVIRDDDGTATSRAQSSWNDFFAVDTRETPYIGDFNGDGRTDLITLTRDNPAAFGDVYVSLSQGDGFGPNTKWNDWFAINSDERVVIGDFDGDGKDDIATWLQKTSGQVYVARSLGTGMEEATLWLGRIGRDPNDLIKAADVNGDGRADLVDFARTEGKVYVSISTGTQFQMPALWHGFFAVSAYERPEVADLNGDGKVDIVTFATNSPTAFGDVYVSLSTGARFGDNDSSVKWHDFFAIRPEEEVRIGDLNGDGRDDFFTFLPPPFAQCYTALSQGTAMGESVLWPEAIAPDTKDGKFVGDVNGDGKADIIIFAQGEGRVYVSLGR